MPGLVSTWLIAVELKRPFPVPCSLILKITVVPRKTCNWRMLLPAASCYPTIPVNQMRLPTGIPDIVIVFKVVATLVITIAELPKVFGLFSDTWSC